MDENGVNRDSKGRITKGSKALNPGGRSGASGLTKHIRSLFGDDLEVCWDELHRLFGDGRTSVANKIKITEMAHDRIYGKPTQYQDIDMNTNNYVVIGPEQSDDE